MGNVLNPSLQPVSVTSASSLLSSSSATALAVALSAPKVEISLLNALAVYNYPAASADMSNFMPTGVVTTSSRVELGEMMAIAIYRGKVEDYTLRSWTFSLDGHDFYVLRLGEEECLVYDTSTGGWSTWRDHDETPWRLISGMNWRGVSRDLREEYESDIVAGDDAFGRLWFLSPDGIDDEHVEDGIPNTPFRREVMTQSVMRGRHAEPCYQVYLTASLGHPAPLNTVELLTSDDAGKNFVSHGALSVIDDDYGQEFAWRSLGQIRAPGRLFWFKDFGAFKRIDSIEMENGAE